jgi:hypothetical protein
MTQKKFFSLALILAILMAGFFYFKLQSEPAKWCRAYFDFECDIKAQFECLGANYTHEKRGSFCENTTCVSVYHIYCQTEDEVVYEYKGPVDCEDRDNMQCGGNM